MAPGGSLEVQLVALGAFAGSTFGDQFWESATAHCLSEALRCVALSFQRETNPPKEEHNPNGPKPTI
eukprot:4864729-Amphidinium_carterae.1